MAKKRPSQRKIRTRGHIIADLSVNHVERQVLLAGYAVQRIVRDYGIDLFVTTFDKTGRLQRGDIRIQIKATDAPEQRKDRQILAVRIDQRDYQHWLLEPMPVILVLFDASQDHSYWLYVQADFEHRKTDLECEGATVTLHIPRTNLLTPKAMEQFAGFRDRMLAQLEGIEHHD